MARKSSSDDSNNNDKTILKGLSSINSGINELKEDIKKSSKTQKNIDTKTTRIAKASEGTSKKLDKTNVELEGIRKEVEKGRQDLKKGLSDLRDAIKSSGTGSGPAANGTPVQSPVGTPSQGTGTSLVPVGGSKIMGTVPQSTLQSKKSAPAQLPGNKVLGLPGPTTNTAATTAQGNKLVNTLKGVGSGILSFLTGRAFWGKMAGAVAEGLIGSKLFGNALGDLIKLGIFLLANFVRNFFGKKAGGIVAILSTIAVGILGLKATLAGLRGIGKLFGWAGRGIAKGSQRVWNWGKSFFTNGKVSKSTALAPLDPTKNLPKNVALWKSASGKSGAVLKMSKPVANALSVATKVAQNPLAKATGKVAPILAAGMGIYGAAKSALHKDWVGAGGHALAAALPAIGGWAGGLLGGAGGTVALPGVGTVSGATLGSAAGTGVGIAGSVALENWLSRREKRRAQSGTAIGNHGVKIQKDVSIISKGVSLISDILKKILNFFSSSPFSGSGVLKKVLSALTGGASSAINAAQSFGEDIMSTINNVTSNGFDSHKITGKFHEKRSGHVHKGVDLAYKKGENVTAKLGGKIVAATTFQGYGNTVIVDSGDAYELYGHLDSINLKSGTVKRGDVIGKAGDSGVDAQGNKVSTGAHLHYEVRKKRSKKENYSADLFFNKLEETEPIKFTTDKWKAESKGSIPTAQQKVLEQAAQGAQQMGATTKEAQAAASSLTKQQIQEGIKNQQKQVKQFPQGSATPEGNTLFSKAQMYGSTGDIPLKTHLSSGNGF